MPQPTFEKPDSLGTDFVDKQVFAELHDVYNDENPLFTYGGVNWPHSVTSEYPQQRKVVQVLASTTERLLDYAHDSLPEVPTSITYDVHTFQVEPGSWQTLANGDSGRWHIDALGHNSLGMVTVATALPTEFLVQSGKRGRRVRKLREHFMAVHGTDYNYDDTRAVDHAIRGGGYDVYTPQPYEAVLMLNHVHQSPQNLTDQTIPRVWLGASMVSERKPTKF